MKGPEGDAVVQSPALQNLLSGTASGNVLASLFQKTDAPETALLEKLTLEQNSVAKRSVVLQQPFL